MSVWIYKEKAILFVRTFFPFPAFSDIYFTSQEKWLGFRTYFLTEANRDEAFKPDYLLGKFSLIGHENFLQIYLNEQSLINEQWRQ